MSQPNTSMQPTNDKELLEKKRTNWGNFAVTIHNTEMQLQVTAQQISATLVAPTKVEDLPAAERALDAAKKNLKTLIDTRKVITGRFDEVAVRLMLPEKSVDQNISTFATAVINVKKQKEIADRASEQKRIELAQVAEKVRIYIADINAAYLTEQAKLISDSYVYALANIDPQSLDEYISKIKKRVTVAKRTMQAPSIKAIHNTQTDIDAEIAKVFKPISAQQYVDDFASDVDQKYFDYKLAWNNKTQALDLNTQEEAENATAITQQKQHETVAATVMALAAPALTVGVQTKNLKSVYKLVMDETFENANIIITAYLSNAQKCRSKLSISKWLTGFGVKQMMGALEKLKAADEKFDFQGLVWTTEDKL